MESTHTGMCTLTVQANLLWTPPWSMIHGRSPRSYIIRSFVLGGLLRGLVAPALAGGDSACSGWLALTLAATVAVGVPPHPSCLWRKRLGSGLAVLRPGLNALSSNLPGDPAEAEALAATALNSPGRSTAADRLMVMENGDPVSVCLTSCFLEIVALIVWRSIATAMVPSALGVAENRCGFLTVRWAKNGGLITLSRATEPASAAMHAIAQMGFSFSPWNVHVGTIVRLRKQNGGICDVLASQHASYLVAQEVASAVESPSVDSVAVELDRERLNVFFPESTSLDVVDPWPGPPPSVVFGVGELLIPLFSVAWGYIITSAGGGQGGAGIDMRTAVGAAMKRRLPLMLADRFGAVTLSRLRAPIRGVFGDLDPLTFVQYVYGLITHDRSLVARLLHSSMRESIHTCAGVCRARAIELDRAAGGGDAHQRVLNQWVRNCEEMNSAVRAAVAGDSYLTPDQLDIIAEGGTSLGVLQLVAAAVVRGIDVPVQTPGTLLAGDFEYSLESASQNDIVPRVSADCLRVAGAASEPAIWDERDYLLSDRLFRASGKHTVAVIGLAHLPGVIRRWGTTDSRVSDALCRPLEGGLVETWGPFAMGCGAAATLEVMRRAGGLRRRAALGVMGVAVGGAVAGGVALYRGMELAGTIAREVYVTKQLYSNPQGLE
jgi:pheromone shutdown protein TraB